MSVGVCFVLTELSEQGDVAEQIIEQSRSFGAGHFLGTIGRGLEEKRGDMIEMYGTDVIPILKRAEVQ